MRSFVFVIKSSSHQVIKLSSHQVIKSSCHQVIKSSRHQGISASAHQVISHQVNFSFIDALPNLLLNGKVLGNVSTYPHILYTEKSYNFSRFSNCSCSARVTDSDVSSASSWVKFCTFWSNLYKNILDYKCKYCRT